MKRLITLLTTIGLVLCLATPASGSFLYTVNFSQIFSGSGQLQFSEPAILTSLTSVSSFDINTATLGGVPVTSVTLIPVASASTCLFSTPSPCMSIFAGGNDLSFSFLTPPTSVGTFGSLTISGAATVPEPSPLLLLASALAAFLFIRHRSTP